MFGRFLTHSLFIISSERQQKNTIRPVWAKSWPDQDWIVSCTGKILWEKLSFNWVFIVFFRNVIRIVVWKVDTQSGVYYFFQDRRQNCWHSIVWSKFLSRMSSELLALNCVIKISFRIVVRIVGTPSGVQSFVHERRQNCWDSIMRSKFLSGSSSELLAANRVFFFSFRIMVRIVGSRLGVHLFFQDRGQNFWHSIGCSLFLAEMSSEFFCWKDWTWSGCNCFFLECCQNSFLKSRHSTWCSSFLSRTSWGLLAVFIFSFRNIIRTVITLSCMFSFRIVVGIAVTLSCVHLFFQDRRRNCWHSIGCSFNCVHSMMWWLFLSGSWWLFFQDRRQNCWHPMVCLFFSHLLSELFFWKVGAVNVSFTNVVRLYY